MLLSVLCNNKLIYKFIQTLYLQAGQSTPKVQTPQTPNPLRRQQAVSVFESDAEEEDADNLSKVESADMHDDKLLKRKCPYCPKVGMSQNFLTYWSFNIIPIT